MIILVSHSSSFDDLSKDWACLCHVFHPQAWGEVNAVLSQYLFRLFVVMMQKQMEIIFLTCGNKYIFPRAPQGERGMGVRNRLIAAFGTPPLFCPAFLLTIICPSPNICCLYSPILSLYLNFFLCLTLLFKIICLFLFYMCEFLPAYWSWELNLGPLQQ